MILDNEIIIKKHPHYYKIILELYNNTDEEYYKIPINKLSKNSHMKIKVKCDICGKEKILTYSKYNKNIKKYNIYSCSEKCAKIKVKLTKKELYDDENYNNMNKNKLTKKELYDDENYNNREKFKNTNLKRYGVTHYNKLKKFIKKIQDTKLKRYNDKNYNNNELMKKIILDKYNTNCTLKLENIKLKSKKTKIEKIKNKYNVDILDINGNIYKCKCENNHIFEINSHLLYDRNKYNVQICPICNPIGHQYSYKEREVLEYIESIYNEKIILNSRKIINPYELDIYLPDLNLAFEFNGIYWHSTKKKKNNYHKNKSDLCEEQNIDLIHIFENEWDTNKSEIINIIYNKIHKKKYKNIDYLFEDDEFIYEDRCFNLKTNKLNFIYNTNPIIISLDRYDIALPGYNIYLKNKNN